MGTVPQQSVVGSAKEEFVEKRGLTQNLGLSLHVTPVAAFLSSSPFRSVLTCSAMSGKKKNRNKLKRTGTGSQSATTAQVGKTELSLSEDSVEVTNGHSSAELNQSAELSINTDTSNVESSGTH